ncbi:MAG: DUF4012 domain-containing protein [Candidatus Moranbacteria bacterium]|nr:DUF4012 domain-containing protein [Candidatus Moranbacteria bacterium]
MNNFNLLSDLETVKREPKERTWKFWVIFWSLAATFLISWFLFLEYKNSNWIEIANFFSPVLKVAPIAEKQKTELQSIFKIASIISETEEVQTFLILLQNNLELRPGGGFIGSFGILKIENGKVIEIDIHDTNVFDDRISTGITPPYPMPETLNIKNWEMRDSNWSPDFPENAKKASYLYKLQGGGEEFDGVAAVSTEILSSFLETVGPVEIEGFPGEYNSGNAIVKLEYQVEKGYKEQDIEKGQRKYIMKYLAKNILDKAQALGIGEKKELLLKLEEHLDQKDIMLNFFNPIIQEEIVKLNWDGEVEQNIPSDYLMIVDANLAAYKTDLYMVRSFKYQVDFSGVEPIAKLDLTYTNTARAKDWMTNDYQSYLRVYVPREGWLLNSSSTRPIKFGEEFDKKYFGTLVQIPINQSRTFHFEYRLPERITFENYSLMIQKQSGISEMEGEIELIDKNKDSQKHEITITQDWELNI